MRRRALFAGAFLSSALGAACAGVLGFEELSTAGYDGGASSDARDDANDGGPEPEACRPAKWPARPTGAPGGGDIRIMNAVQSFDFGLSQKMGADIRVPGFDLDGFCTVREGENSCRTDVVGQSFESYVLDKDGFDGGRDNSAYRLLAFLGAVTDEFKQDRLNDRITSGEVGLIVRVSAYNGQAEDADVSVELIPTFGVQAGGAPKFDETDSWIRDPFYWNQTTYDGSTIIDTAAYVTGGKLVARFETAVITLPFDQSVLRMPVKDAVLVAEITPSGGSYLLTKTELAGRAPTNGLLQGIGRIYRAASGDYVCHLDQFYGIVKATACPARDIASETRLDRTGRACDAISVGVRLATVPVQQKKLYAPATDGGNPCAGSSVENDDCAPAADAGTD